jgi:site-specific DNA-methyltransferase (adenine-specific)
MDTRSSKIRLLHGDCFKRMLELDENSVQALISDPPYGLSFMGKAWDRLALPEPDPAADLEASDLEEESEEKWDVQQIHAHQEWHRQWCKAAFRALMPGGLIKAFGGTRTFHRLAAAMKDVGFEIVGVEAWCYGSGFPKSLDISKAIDRHLGAQREVIQERTMIQGGGSSLELRAGERREVQANITAPSSDLAKKWAGYGTALKPAWEPFVVGRKPFKTE